MVQGLARPFERDTNRRPRLVNSLGLQIWFFHPRLVGIKRHDEIFIHAPSPSSKITVYIFAVSKAKQQQQQQHRYTF